MIKDNRSNILKRIRDNLQATYLPSASNYISPRPAQIAVLPQTSANIDDMVRNFTRDLEAVGAKVHHPQNPASAIDLVLDLIAEFGGSEILAWGDDALPLAGLPNALDFANIKRANIYIPDDSDKRKQTLEKLSEIKVGLTGTLAGLADTGTLVLQSSPTRPRLASLLPPTHIALISLKSLYPSMASFFAAHPHLTQNASNLVFISGPSRTADIELTLTVGVHGPKIIHIVLIE